MASTQVASAGAKKAIKAPQSESTHPPYVQMIKEAITQLKNRKGSSRFAILKYIKEHYDINENHGDNSTNRFLNKALKHGVETGELKHATSHANGATGSFKLGDKATATKKKTSPKKSAPAVAAGAENGNAGSTPKKSKKTTATKKSAVAAGAKKSAPTVAAKKTTPAVAARAENGTSKKTTAAKQSPAPEKTTKKTKATTEARGKKAAAPKKTAAKK